MSCDLKVDFQSLDEDLNRYAEELENMYDGEDAKICNLSLERDTIKEEAVNEINVDNVSDEYKFC